MKRSTIFYQLLTINKQAFEKAQYNVAYHALASALYAAQDEGNASGCLRVSEIANEQAEFIDNYAPEYQHSSASASKRGINGGGIFVMLVRQSKLTVEMI